MTLTVLDAKTALVVIDLQKGLMSYPVAHPMDVVVKQASLLAQTFRRRGLPVVLVNADGVAPGRTEQARGQHLPTAEDWTDLIPELNRQPQDHLVTKRTHGAFTNTDLEAYLKAQAVTQVVIVGVATSIGVEATARHAYELGFNVSLAVDAMTDLGLEAHNNSVAHIFPRIGETGATQDVIDLLEARAASPSDS